MDKVLFPGLKWWLLALVPITVLGFYPSYFSILLEPMANVYHVHAFFMSLWIVMAIVQPFLIHYKKLRMHRMVGNASYFIMPVVFITAYLVIRHTYLIKLEDSVEDPYSEAASRIILGSIYFIWLVVFYVLAIVNRKVVVIHATYMLAAILTLLGPTADRLLYNTTEAMGIEYNFFLENIVFVFILLLLTVLAVYQKRRGYPIKAAIISIAIYVVGIVALFGLPDTHVWTSFAGLVM